MLIALWPRLITTSCKDAANAFSGIIAPLFLPSTASPFMQNSLLCPGWEIWMQDTSGFFDFGLAGGDTLTESGKGCALPRPCLSCSSALAHRVCSKRWGFGSSGLCPGKGRRSDVPGDVDAVNNRLRLQPPPFQTSEELLFYSSVPRTSDVLSAALRAAFSPRK